MLATLATLGTADLLRSEDGVSILERFKHIAASGIADACFISTVGHPTPLRSFYVRSSLRLRLGAEAFKLLGYMD